MSSMSLVILGASGDLTKRLLMPSLFRLHQLGMIPTLKIIGYSIDKWDRETFIAHLREAVFAFVPDADESVWHTFSQQLDFVSGSLEADALKQLAATLSPSSLFYLALPPTLFGQAAEAIGQAGLAEESGEHWRRIIIEKPFGTDLTSAMALRNQVHRYWNESQVYRIDHFLGKEATQNLMLFRFANRVLAPVWQAEHIEQVQITYAETLGVENRAVYYDKSGATRDMLQNHLMQLLTLTAIEPLGRWDGEILRDHKVEVLKSIRPTDDMPVDDWAVRGQYCAGQIDGQSVTDFCNEPNIPIDTTTETFSALRFEIDNWRWKGVPFYLRSGKRLKNNYAEIAVEFKAPAGALPGDLKVNNNWLIFRMGENMGMDMHMTAKMPGMHIQTHDITLSAPYTQPGQHEVSAYEQLLIDALNGERAHFLRFDEVEWAWRVIVPALKAWEQGCPDLYKAGTEGPDTQNRIMRPGHRWRPLAEPKS
ncbi:glucose-6-phosphate dehydrogenase [Pantoea sp. 1.19]|uniref:glucose-6-phosphate dehydrogenase n=1 Tax=Pantoea sp. 1.19 TaxID=1925589 RepID=UPI000948FA4C|nr:glucose-6-phosphate dehydrogenase [Pantoea sp. 1.19]